MERRNFLQVIAPLPLVPLLPATEVSKPKLPTDIMSDGIPRAGGSVTLPYDPDSLELAGAGRNNVLPS